MAAYFPASSSTTVPVFLFLIVIICFLCSYQFHLTIAKPTTGFSLKLIHRDSPHSPLYPGNLSYVDRIRRLVDISESRVLQIQSMATANSPSSQTPIHPNTPRPPVDRRAFLFVVQLSIGTPNKPYWLLLDTGSDLIWTQCKPCNPCFPQKAPPFDPKISSSYKTFPCSHILCSGMKCEDGKCIYTISYGNGAATRGVLSNETITFLSDNGAPEAINGIGFGCSTASKGFIGFKGEIDGILGMNASPLSLSSQLRNQINGRFSYCLVHSLVYPRQITSFLRFGDHIVVRGRPVQTTPFAMYKVPSMYALSLIDISLGNYRMGFPPGTFALKPDGNGGCLIDSGTAITFMDTVPYIQIKRMLMQHFENYHLTKIDEKRYKLDLCYRLPQNFTNFPPFTFHFLQGADLRVTAENVYNFNPDQTFCLAMIPKDGITLIGAMQQQNTRFVYDLGRRELTFAPEDCSKDVE